MITALSPVRFGIARKGPPSPPPPKLKEPNDYSSKQVKLLRRWVSLNMRAHTLQERLRLKLSGARPVDGLPVTSREVHKIDSYRRNWNSMREALAQTGLETDREIQEGLALIFSRDKAKFYKRRSHLVKQLKQDNVLDEVAKKRLKRRIRRELLEQHGREFRVARVNEFLREHDSHPFAMYVVVPPENAGLLNDNNANTLVGKLDGFFPNFFEFRCN